MRIDLDKLEAIARAADKDNPGVCYSADHVDGYPSAQSAMDLFNAMDPATSISLIRRIRLLEQIAKRALGEWREWHGETRTSNTEGWKATEAEIAALVEQVDGGTVRYGRHPVGYEDRWDIDRPADDSR